MKIKKFLFAISVISMLMCPNMVITSAETVTAETEETGESERITIEGLGISYKLPSGMKEDELKIGISKYTPVAKLGILNIRIDMGDLYFVLVYPERFYQEEAEEDHYSSIFLQNYENLEYKEETVGEYHYTFLDLTRSLELDGYAEDELKCLDRLLPMCEELIDSIEYTELDSGKVTFDSLNLDGEQVTDSIFAEKKMTVVNVWATYCNPCINEMPELAEWEKEMGEDVQILYVCSDIMEENSDNISLANMIADRAGIDRTHVIYNLPGTFTDIMMQITGVPTTFFVNQDGEMMENLVIGASVDKYKALLERYLREISEQ